MNAATEAFPGEFAQKILDAGEAGLWDQLEGALLARLDARPDDVNAMRRLAECYRQHGDLEQAGIFYGRIARLTPEDDHSASLAALCNGESTAIPLDHGPAPFVAIRDFLPAERRQQLLDLLKANQEQLAELTVGYERKIDRSKRLQYGIVHLDSALREILACRIDSILPDLLTKLNIDAFPVEEHYLRVDATPDGGFNAMHRDALPGARLSYLYYFHTEPKQYTGGHLLLFDRPGAKDETRPLFTTIRNEDNKLVVFRPDDYHQATRVRAQSANLGLLESRLSVCGFLFEKTAPL